MGAGSGRPDVAAGSSQDPTLEFCPASRPRRGSIGASRVPGRELLVCLLLVAGAEAFRGGAEVAGEAQGHGRGDGREGLHRRPGGVGGFK